MFHVKHKKRPRKNPKASLVLFRSMMGVTMSRASGAPGTIGGSIPIPGLGIAMMPAIVGLGGRIVPMAGAMGMVQLAICLGTMGMVYGAIVMNAMLVVQLTVRLRAVGMILNAIIMDTVLMIQLAIGAGTMGMVCDAVIMDTMLMVQLAILLEAVGMIFQAADGDTMVMDKAAIFPGTMVVVQDTPAGGRIRGCCGICGKGCY